MQMEWPFNRAQLTDGPTMLPITELLLAAGLFRTARTSRSLTNEKFKTGKEQSSSRFSDNGEWSLFVVFVVFSSVLFISKPKNEPRTKSSRTCRTKYSFE